MAMPGTAVNDHLTAMRFDRILVEYQDRVYNQAYRMLGNREDAEEAAQDVFLKVHRSLGEFRGESKFSTWIYRITANECISRLRKKQLDTQSLDDPIGEDGSVFGDLVPDHTDSVDTVLETAETAERIRAMVRDLPPEWAMALSMYHFDDLSYDEIAAAMDIPKATVATYIFRGRKKLVTMLMEYSGS